MQLVTAFKAKPKDWLAAGGGKKEKKASRENNINRMCNMEICNVTAARDQTRDVE